MHAPLRDAENKAQSNNGRTGRGRTDLDERAEKKGLDRDLRPAKEKRKESFFVCQVSAPRRKRRLFVPFLSFPLSFFCLLLLPFLPSSLEHPKPLPLSCLSPSSHRHPDAFLFPGLSVERGIIPPLQDGD